MYTDYKGVVHHRHSVVLLLNTTISWCSSDVTEPEICFWMKLVHLTYFIKSSNAESPIKFHGKIINELYVLNITNILVSYYNERQ